MTLDEAITSCMEVVAEEMELYREICATACFVSPVCTETAKTHLQLAEWLEELKQRRKQSEVQHGRWIDNGEDKFICSDCNGYVYRWFGKSDFCPRCGAKMDGGADNG